MGLLSALAYPLCMSSCMALCSQHVSPEIHNKKGAVKFNSSKWEIELKVQKNGLKFYTFSRWMENACLSKLKMTYGFPQNTNIEKKLVLDSSYSH